MQFLRTNTATRITVGPFLDKTDGVTPETAITVTSCKLTMTVDDGGVPTLVLDTAPTASGGANDMVHITGDDAGYYDLELAAANVNYLGRAKLAITDAATHCPVFMEFMILPAVVYDSFVLGTDVFQVDVTQFGGSNLTSASGIPEVKVASIAANAITAAATAADFGTEIAAAVWDALTSGMSTVGSIGKKLADWVVGTIDTYTGNTKQTGDAYARLGAPAGASVSADIAAVKSETAAILDDTGTSGVVVAAASKTGYRLSATGVDDILDEVVQGTATVRQLLGWMGASTQGVSSGYGTGTVTFYYNDGTTAALIVTISGGNRTAITRA